ncbi:ribonuclease HI [Brucepastera parasyntrophica]|uniref:ribonuclease HI n=1 Tax=Brucepastera parasyntrophica TaxID=2880008 RepID=UPI00210D7641|nr:ribonuclease HI [Brucepastera parasyntrophica]ULQ59355.1 ribonuclease HI [Brucepastera parasyntrophica]
MNDTKTNGSVQRHIRIYTDGGCSGNPGPGGWGFVIVDETEAGEKKEVICSGGEKLTTNNRMELNAVIKALETVSDSAGFAGRKITVYTDSQYVQKGITEWIRTWKKNSWKTAAKQPVKNRDLWEILDALSSKLDLSWEWVKGHAGIYYNELCDELTQKEIKKFSEN